MNAETRKIFHEMRGQMARLEMFLSVLDPEIESEEVRMLLEIGKGSFEGLKGNLELLHGEINK